MRGVRILTLLLVAFLCSCGGSSSSTPPPNLNGTPAGTYTLMVTATANGGVQQTLSLTLVIQ